MHTRGFGRSGHRYTQTSTLWLKYSCKPATLRTTLFILIPVIKFRCSDLNLSIVRKLSKFNLKFPYIVRIYVEYRIRRTLKYNHVLYATKYFVLYKYHVPSGTLKVQLHVQAHLQVPVRCTGRYRYVVLVGTGTSPVQPCQAGRSRRSWRGLWCCC